PAALLRKVEELPTDTAYAAAVVMAGLADAVAARDSKAAQAQFVTNYAALLDALQARSIPTLVAEILPIVTDYEKNSYGVPPAQINQLIRAMNEGLYGIALEKADAMLFTERILGGRVHAGKGS